MREEVDEGELKLYSFVMLKSLYATYMFVENIKESSSWYSTVLNIPLEIDDENFALLRIGDNELCFHQADSKSPLSTGGSVSYWRVDDLKIAIEHFKSHGGIVYRGPIEIPENNDGICQIKDPFGNVFGMQGHFQND